MIKKFNLFFLTFFFVGRFKYAPGTIASFFTCILFLLMISVFDLSVIFFIALIIFVYSFFAINNSFDEFKSDDPQEIVIDEVVGQILVLLAIPIYETLYIAPIEYYCVAAFLLFRFFDIVKPFPVSYVDNNTKGALGIMLDDILAGIYAIIVITIVLFFIGG